MEDSEITEGRLLQFAFRGGVLGSAWARLTPSQFRDIAERLPIGIAVYGPTGDLLFENRRFMDGSTVTLPNLSDHVHGGAVDGRGLPLARETCPVCLVHETGRPAIVKVGTPIFSWSTKWRWIRAEPMTSGGMAVVTVDAGRTFRTDAAEERRFALISSMKAEDL